MAITAANTALSVILLMLGQALCEGFDFTLNHDVDDSSRDTSARHVCGVLRCTETLTGGSNDLGNLSRSLTGFTVSKIRPSEDGSTAPARWQLLASVTPQQPTLNRVSDGTRISGQLSGQQASLSVELTKTHDCHDSQFSCVAVSEDDKGRKSVKTSLVGKAVDSPDFGPHVQTEKVSMPPLKAPASGDKMSLAGVLLQLTNSIQMKFDMVESRLENSLRAIENRLEDENRDLRAVVNDKTGGLDNSMEGRFGALDNRLNYLENRLEDKMLELNNRMIQAERQTKIPSFDSSGALDQLASKLDGLDSKLETNTGKLDSCLAEVMKQTESTVDVRESLSGQLAVVATSVQAIGKNLTNYDRGLDQCADTAAVDNTVLTDLVSSVHSLSGLTQDLVSRVSSFRDAYESGALVPVDEFFDPLGTGKKEWRLAFRGTPYNNVRLYPAYMLGTGIPLEVEQGCKQFNHSLPCVNHYRNRDALDNWAGVDEVLFAIYENGQMVKKVVFNGKGSTFTSWFAADRVIQSSWNDLTSQPHNYFSVVGAEHGDHWRRFLINRAYGGCGAYNGWFKATETNGGGCADEKKALAFPVFYYAPGDTFTIWPSAAARADAFGIFLKYE